MNVCRSCKAPIVWAISATSGAPMPIDPEPHPHGNLHLEPPASLGAMRRATVVPGPERVKHAGRLHLSHFASCPYAPQYRRCLFA